MGRERTDVVDGFLKGIGWDVEQGAGITLRLSADPAVWGRLVPHQLRMMQERAMDRLLPAAAGEEDGRIVLLYDLTGKRRLVQRLYADPPDFRQAAELAHRLVRTVAGCRDYMLHESGFVLHEDFVYAGSRPSDFRLIYLPLSGAAERRLMPPVTAQLRLLVLRILSFVREPLPAAAAPVLGLLGQEPYAVAHLEQALRKLRYGASPPEDAAGEPGEGGSLSSGGRFGLIRRWRSARWWAAWTAGRNGRDAGEERDGRDGRNRGRMPAEMGGMAASGDKTGLLARPEPGPDPGTGAVKLVVETGEKTETAVMEGDRFLIGRNAGSVHFVIGRRDVSRIHCEIARTPEGFAATDLGSLNGTLLNGEPMMPFRPYPFGPGDRLRVAGAVIRLAELSGQTETPETASPFPAQAGKPR
jgi:hypothetical protein